MESPPAVASSTTRARSRKRSPHRPDSNSDVAEAENPSNATRALLIHWVLGNIARNLPIKDVATLRQTCSTWNQELIAELRTKCSPISLQSTTEPGVYSWLPAKCVMSEYTDLMSMANSSSKIPFTSYKVSDITHDDFLKLHRFFSICGEAVHTLNLRIHKGEVAANIDTAREVIFGLTPNLAALTICVWVDGGCMSVPAWTNNSRNTLPKLRSLDLEFSGSFCLAYLHLLNDLIKSAVDLRYLSLLLRRNSGSTDVIDNGPAVMALRDVAPRLDILQTLIIHRAKAEEMEVLIALSQRPGNSLHLECFETSISFDSGSGTIEQLRLRRDLAALHTFLTMQSASLGQFRIALEWHYAYALDFRPELRIPSLRLLRTFGLRGSGLSEFNIHFEEGGTLGSTFPQLQRFESNSRNLGCGSVRYINQLTHDGVTDLVLTGFQDEELTKFRTLFQRVTRLELNHCTCKIEKLQPIWTTWPGLKVLTIEYAGQGNFDRVLTGLSKNSLIFLKAKTTSAGSHLTLDKLQELQTKYKCQPGISDLKHLRDFSLVSTGSNMGAGASRQDIITDIGGYFGIALVSRTLQRITIRTETQKLSCLSAECEALIRNTFGPLVTIDIGGTSAK